MVFPLFPVPLMWFFMQYLWYSHLRTLFEVNFMLHTALIKSAEKSNAH